ncbi:MAG: hypothetical protein H7A25_11940 [Leptospiraceae bacterium]|nr:hypothetical protein [Leptospiraceae bacterium]
MDIYFIIILSMIIVSGLSLLMFGISVLLPSRPNKKKQEGSKLLLLPDKTNPSIEKY